MSESVIKVYGALRICRWTGKLLEASNLVVLRESSFIHSNANLEVHGQGLLNLSGPGDIIEAQRLVLSLFYSIRLHSMVGMPFSAHIHIAKQEDQIQGAIYGPSIEILQKTFKLYHCYSMTNAPVGTIPQLFRYLVNPYRLTLCAKTPIEETQIDGFTMRSLKYNFTQLADLEKMPDTDAKLSNLHIYIPE
ncbi:hypothetical protein Vadar_005743 [Vaccinium darrowii]|uniref:Uncharacterized protein n=1 Tax=Vaccinium darrowii TaxID=229202 RepID=A0ACB7ZAN1_9ERIC|nr:hypothetical protein Vadar_005743 [Vaccinium darrowii]